MGWEVSSGLGVRAFWPLLHHTAHFQPRWEGVAIRFAAGPANAPPETCTPTGTEPGHRAHANAYTRKPGHSATARGSQGHRKCSQSFHALGTHVHTHSPGVSHTESRTHTQARGRPVAPQLWFLREQGEREGGPGRPRAAPPGRRASLSEAVGAVGGGTRVLAPLSLPSPRLNGPPFPTCPPCGPNFSLSHLPASCQQRGSRSEPGVSPHPPREGGRGGCTPGDESRARPGSCPGAGGEGGEKALAGSPSAESLARRLLLAFPGPAAEEPWDQGSAL